jgi:DNA repair photolyase
MSITITSTTVKNILTRTSGYLRTIASHSLQPYRGCTFGNAACGVGCYVQHSQHLLQGRTWGSFLEVRTNAAESYLANVATERRWAYRRQIPFTIFCSSATDPFVPQEARFRVTDSVLRAMLTEPPDELILQTHSHVVADSRDLLWELSSRCRLRVHVSIETDLDPFPGLPPHASPVESRLKACAQLKAAGLRVIVTVSPLLPIADPARFFARVAEVADAVVIDHFIQGDGSEDGSRTLRTPLPAAMRAVNPESVTLAYRDHIVAVARQQMPGRVGVNIDGFEGKWLPG